ncbi:hypothetical protein ACVWW6_003984 [Bradyrhizobium sp. USDA 3311]|nr:hypothetical protein [Bradyrhizobium japonicum]
MEPRSCGVLDSPPSRGMTTGKSDTPLTMGKYDNVQEFRFGVGTSFQRCDTCTGRRGILSCICENA